MRDPGVSMASQDAEIKSNRSSMCYRTWVLEQMTRQTGFDMARKGAGILKSFRTLWHDDPDLWLLLEHMQLLVQTYQDAENEADAACNDRCRLQILRPENASYLPLGYV